MSKLLIALFSICLAVQAQAFPCFFTLVKDSCWTNYNLSVIVRNASTGKSITTVTVPQGKSWAREQFDCQPAEQISFSATFTPVFWEADIGKIYPSRHDWSLPEAVTAGDTAWNLNICYPSEFAEVPLPPEASSHCGCKTDNIPPVKPQ